MPTNDPSYLRSKTSDRCPLCDEQFRQDIAHEERISCPRCNSQFNAGINYHPILDQWIENIKSGAVIIPRSGRGRLSLTQAGDITLTDSGIQILLAKAKSIPTNPKWNRFKTILLNRLASHWKQKISCTPCRQQAGLEQLSIGVMCRAQDIQAIAHILKSYAKFVRGFVILVDSDDPQRCAQFAEDLTEIEDVSPEIIKRTVIDHRLLAGDFGRQRNQLHQLCKTPWILHLDSDEALSDDVFSALNWMIPTLKFQGLKLLQLRRINLVDNKITNHYPDWCVSVISSDVQITGKVHEEPAHVDWWRKGYCPYGYKIHFIEGIRLTERDLIYASLDENKQNVIQSEAQLLRTQINIKIEDKMRLEKEIDSIKLKNV